MPSATRKPTLPEGAIELANLSSRPAFTRADSDSLPLPVTTPIHVRRALSSPVPARPHPPRPQLPSPLRSPSSFGQMSFTSNEPLRAAQPLGSPGSSSGRRPSIVHTPKFLGRATAYRPAYLLGLGTSGATLFGIGTTILQKALWPARVFAGLDPDGDTLIPAGTPGRGVVTGTEHGDAALGGVLVSVGITLSLFGSSLFFLDACRLAKRQNSANPNLVRPRAYFAAHIFGLGCLVGSRFLAEAMRKHLPDNQSWLLTVPGALGTAIFAVTQAQSFSSCELYNGTMPLKRRALLSQVARGGVSAWIVLGALAGTPNMSSYVREGVKLVAQTSTALAFSLSLTEARMMERDHPSAPPIGPLRFRGDFTALQAFGLYSFARLLSAISAAMFEYAQWPADRSKIPPLGEQGPKTGWRGLPPPIPSTAPLPLFVPEAVTLMAMAVAVGAYAFFQLRKDLLPRGKLYANIMFASAVSCLLLGQTYRVLVEHSKAHADFRELWFAMPVGLVANAIAYVVIPEMIAQAEITQGNKPVSYRYQVMEACRFSGTCCWALWVAMSAIQFIPPLVRQSIATAASLFTILAMALPDATTRSRQTGFYTPAVERPTFL